MVRLLAETRTRGLPDTNMTDKNSPTAAAVNVDDIESHNAEDVNVSAYDTIFGLEVVTELATPASRITLPLVHVVTIYPFVILVVFGVRRIILAPNVE